MAKMCTACKGTGYSHGGEVEEEDDDPEIEGMPPEGDEADEEEEALHARQVELAKPRNFAEAMKRRKMGRN